jgi:UPF0176 protein
VFDDRMSVDFSGDTAVIGECHQCGAATNHMQNCGDASCRVQLVVCDEHSSSAFCPQHLSISL